MKIKLILKWLFKMILKYPPKIIIYCMTVYFLLLLLCKYVESSTENIIREEMSKVNRIEIFAHTMYWDDELLGKKLLTLNEDEVVLIKTFISDIDPIDFESILLQLKCLCAGDLLFKCHQKNGNVFSFTLHHGSGIRFESFSSMDYTISSYLSSELSLYLASKGINKYEYMKKQNEIDSTIMK